MTATLASILGLTIGSSLLGLAGGFLLLWREQAARRWTTILVSFGAGGLIGATFLELLPEALAEADDASRVLTATLLGILVFFTVEKLLVWHHHSHEHDTGEDTHHPTHLPTTAAVRPLIIVGDALHNFLDGAVIAVAFLVNPQLGVITALAVLVHELPSEIGDFSILLHSGMRRRAVAWWNVLGALVAPLGALVAVLADERFRNIEVPLLAFAAGSFIYIALADLLPSMQHQRQLRQGLAQLALLLIGVGVIWTLGQLLPGA